jgi:hypothetical protein
MKICRNKTTNKIIEAQDRATAGTLIQNALNAGYNLADIEELEVTEQEYNNLLANNPALIKQNQRQEIQSKLETLDKVIPRGLEDTLDMLISKSVIAENDIPSYVKTRKKQKQNLRQELQDLG